MPKYTCINKCWFNTELYQVGQVVTFKKGEKVPRHFEANKGESTLERLREECMEKGYYIEAGFGVDKLNELLGYELPHHIKVSQAQAAEKLEKELKEE